MIDDLHHNMNLVIPGLNFWGDQNDAAKSVVDKTKWVMQAAIDRIEKLEAVTKDDAKWLAAYHKWCEMHGCAPSSSDLISARKALEGKDDPQADL
jgi:hypothetical protein